MTLRSRFTSAALLLAGCVSPAPIEHALSNGMLYRILPGAGFRHVVMQRHPAVPSASLHVYIEGDGTPWRLGREPATDPTPRDALALRLAVADPGAVAYVGRPCYFGLRADKGCSQWTWTYGRYSPQVVTSMAAVIRALYEDGEYAGLVLIGHSGGGTLAMLLASELPETVGALTLAANLDVAAWVAHHRYEPLSGSLNPADMPPGHSFCAAHATGGRDRIVPATVTESYLRRHPGELVWRFDDFDHRCCWEREWASILERYRALLAGGCAGQGRTRDDQELEVRRRAHRRPLRTPPHAATRIGARAGWP